MHAAKGYPLLAPNGSSIVLYGYETGLKVVWRGGRQFSEEQPVQQVEKPKGKGNGGDDAIMVIDSDEERAPEPANEDPSCQYDTEESEVDPTYPFEDILRQIDIPLGTRVLGVAVPRVLPETARSPLEPFPPVLTKKIIVAAVCADFSTRVVTLPLAPPHPETDPSTQIQTLLVNGGVSHQEVPRGISITFTCQEEEQLGTSRRSNTKGLDSRESERWGLLVATHSAEASGLLLLHQIPIMESDGVYHMSEEDIESRRRYLPSPAKSIAFNPSSYPSARHSTLLVAFHSGCVKIYSCFSTRSGSRKLSAYSELEGGTEGKWLISLYPGFEQSASGIGRRKTVVDAEWVLGGRAVMVLLAGGEWGVWDIEGAGPGSMKGPLERQSSIQGVSGGSLTAYSVSGKILRPFPESRSETGGEQRKFAPMTPSTRRVREDNLLKGSGGTPSNSLCGQISVFQTNSSREALPDESVLVRHGSQSAAIPSLLSLWRNATKATGTFDSSNRCRLSSIPDINLMGESFNGIDHVPAAARRTRQTGRTEFDILITAEHQIVILAPALSEPLKSDFQRAMSEKAAAEKDLQMLRKGELDVNGMERVLSGMARSQMSQMSQTSPVKRGRIFS